MPNDTAAKVAELIKFEDDIAQLFLDKQIRAPIHLSGGNERQLIHIFKEHFKPGDYVCSNWRSHYHAMLAGIPPEQVRQAIIDGRSISLCFPSYRFISSAIVGGIAPIAVGIAMGIKRKNEDRKVLVFIGDMGCETGSVFESVKYAINHSLPIRWFIEDNGMSVSTDTLGAWGDKTGMSHPSVLRYEYRLNRAHVGVGKFVEF